MTMNEFWIKRDLFRAPADEAGAGEAPAAPAEAAAPEGGGAETPPETAAPDLSFLPESYKKDDGAYDLDRFRSDYEAMQAERDARPEVPDAYEWKSPEDLDLGVELPEGVEIQVQADDPQFQPLFEELGGFMKEAGLPQEAAGKMMGLLQKYEARKYAALNEAATKEYETLGADQAARDARVGEVMRTLESRLPAEQVQALTQFTTSAAALKALEALVKPSGPNAPPSEPKPQPAAASYAYRYPKSA